MMVDLSENFSWSAHSDSQRTYTQNGIYKILRNYEDFKNKLEKIQRILNNTVKPEGIELIQFTK